MMTSACAPTDHGATGIRGVTLWGLGINLALAALKFVAGVIAASQALVADGVHSLSDSVTDVVVLVGAPLWSAPPDAKHPHGHGRIETLITVVIALVLASVGIGLAYRALTTLHQGHTSAPGWLALVAACISIATKEALYQWTLRVGRRLRSSAVMANAWHHRSDALSSVPVVAAVLATRLEPAWGFVDHVAAVLVSAFILHASWQIFWPAFSQLIDAGASLADRQRIVALIQTVDGVRGMHALRTRYLGSSLHIDFHLLVDPQLSVRDGHEIARQVKRHLLAQGPQVADVLIHVEPDERL